MFVDALSFDQLMQACLEVEAQCEQGGNSGPFHEERQRLRRAERIGRG
jgi:hypothetical protein